MCRIIEWRDLPAPGRALGRVPLLAETTVCRLDRWRSNGWTTSESSSMTLRRRLISFESVMFAVDDIDDTLERLRKRGAQLVGEVVRYRDAYRLCYIRGPEGLLIGLAEELGAGTTP